MGGAPGAERRSRLTSRERRLLAVLGVTTFGLALSITVVSTYLPGLLEDFTSSGTMIGLIIGAEGAFALFLPLLVGAWSDSVDSRLGSHGAVTGLYSLSRGVGVVLGPLLAGLAIDLLRPALASTQGHSAMFLVASAGLLLSIPLMRSMKGSRPRRIDLAPDASPVSAGLRTGA